MPQVKKSDIQDRILESAFSLVSAEGYQAASMPKIAKKAGITPGNIYRYYNSKFELFHDVIANWLDQQMEEFEASLADVMSPDIRLRRILVFMWIDLPKAENMFMINLIEALATKKDTDRYSRGLIERSEARIQRQLELCQSSATWFPLSIPDLSHIIFKCHDGFVLESKLDGDRERVEAIIDSFVASTVRVVVDA